MVPSEGSILAVASAGGHWEQLQIVSAAFADRETTYVTTKQELLDQSGHRGAVVRDCNRTRPWDSLICLVQCWRIVSRTRPAIVLSTGAAPGLHCVAIGRLMGARTIWVDSIANVERLSLSGRLARWIVHRRFTQWRHLAKAGGPEYAGQLL